MYVLVDSLAPAVGDIGEARTSQSTRSSLWGFAAHRLPRKGATALEAGWYRHHTAMGALAFTGVRRDWP